MRQVHGSNCSDNDITAIISGSGMGVAKTEVGLGGEKPMQEGFPRLLLH